MTKIDLHDQKTDKEPSQFSPMYSKSDLKVQHGFASEAGNKEENEDNLGIRIPDGPELVSKGISAVIADGVSVAESGKEAAGICIGSFLNDYYSAPDAWTTETAGKKVIKAMNRSLFGLGQSRASLTNGYITTFAGLVIKAVTAHIFHVGDSRVWRLRGGALEQLTRDHSVNYGKGNMGLTRSMGMEDKVEVDYVNVGLKVGDIFLLSTDGVHDFLTDKKITEILSDDSKSYKERSEKLVSVALENGSDDNLTALCVEVEALGTANSNEVFREFKRLPFPPDLYPGMVIDGWEVLNELAATSRSQTYCVKDVDTGVKCVMKTPSVNFEDDPAYLERFIMEGWVASRIVHKHLVGIVQTNKPQNFLYNVLQYVEGVPLDEWMKENPDPEISQLVEFVCQIARGLRSMHRQEMLHQDIKPGNIIIHPERGAVIIDYGSTYVAAIEEIPAPFEREKALGTLEYSAPEYFLGKRPSRLSDQFSLGVVAYYMLSGGKLPYGDKYERCNSVREFTNLKYRESTEFNSMVPIWLDGAIKKVVSINPQSRYDTYSEFEFDLKNPNPKFTGTETVPLIQRTTANFWMFTAITLFVTQVITLVMLAKK